MKEIILKSTTILFLVCSIIFISTAQEVIEIPAEAMDIEYTEEMETEVPEGMEMPLQKKVFHIVEEMPRFSGCEEIEDRNKRNACAQKKMQEYLAKNIKYPAAARKKGTTGTVVIRFVVNTDGRVSDAEILRDIGEGCGAEALRVVNTMNDIPNLWIPGKQRGKVVPVYFNLPFRFRL